MRVLLCVLSWLAFAVGPGALAGTLVINANTSDPAPRAAWEAAVEDFRKANPDIDVEFNVYDHESYKKSIRNWLTSASPDILFWNAGYRMRQFVLRGLLENISDLFDAETRSEFAPAAIDLVSVAGEQYGIPFAHYQIGLYYRRDLLERASIKEPPRQWPELLDACDKLRAAGAVAIVIGSRDLWPTAAWFDYLNLRLNGLAFHQELMEGKVPYTDPRVRAVFVKWRELIDRDCFVENHASLSWQESQSLLYQEKGAMMLIGNFIVASFPPELRGQMDFAPFPTLDPKIGRFEEAPMNSLHIPARAKNKTDARRFLAYVMRADVQERINAATLTIPANVKAAVAQDRFLLKGHDLLASADGLSQYFDRDTSEELATVAMKAFQEFMINPDRLDAVIEVIERTRRRIYKPS